MSNPLYRLTWKTAWIKNVSSLNTMNASLQKFFEQTLSIKQHRVLFSLLSQPKVKKCSFNMRLPGHQCNRPMCRKKALWRKALHIDKKLTLFNLLTYLSVDRESWGRKVWIRQKAGNSFVKDCALLIEAKVRTKHSMHSSVQPDRGAKGNIFWAGVTAAAETFQQRTRVVLKVRYLQRHKKCLGNPNWPFALGLKCSQ